MALKTYAAATVGTTAASILTLPSTGSSQQKRTVTVFNNGSATIFIGDSTVTTANGTPVAAGVGYSFDSWDALDVWSVSGSAGQNVRLSAVA